MGAVLGAGVQKRLGVLSDHCTPPLSSVIPVTSHGGSWVWCDQRHSGKGLRVPEIWLRVPQHQCLSPPAQAVKTALEPCTRNHYFWSLCDVKNLGFCLLSWQIWKDCGTVLFCVMALVNPEVQVQQKGIYVISFNRRFKHGGGVSAKRCVWPLFLLIKVNEALVLIPGQRCRRVFFKLSVEICSHCATICESNSLLLARCILFCQPSGQLLLWA